jgi:hypothetical protein
MVSPRVLKSAEVFEPLISRIPFVELFLSGYVCFYRMVSPHIEFDRAVAGHTILDARILIRAYVCYCHVLFSDVSVFWWILLFNYILRFGLDAPHLAHPFQEHSRGAVEQGDENQKANLPIVVYHFE